MSKSALHLAALLTLGVAGLFAAQEDSVASRVRPKLGLWYTAWWTADDQFRHWTNCHRFPVRGRYTAGDPEIIKAHFAQFRDLGVDFLIMDDTNCAGNDGGRINDNIRAWFDFMDQQPATNRIPICRGGGGEMRGGCREAQQRAADFYWANWAQRPGYFKVERPAVVAGGYGQELRPRRLERPALHRALGLQRRQSRGHEATPDLGLGQL